MEPKLFLDVDGCLIVHHDLGGYKSFEYNGDTFWYDPQTPQRIEDIDVLYDIYWASHSWRGKALDFLAKEFQIVSKRMELDFSVVERDRDGNMWPEKLAAIKKKCDCPSAVVDDRMGPEVDAWAKGKTVLLIQPDKHVGLTEDEYNLLMSFGELHNTNDELVSGYVGAPEGKEGPVLSNGEWF